MQTERLLNYTASASVAVAVILILVKLVAWGMSGSVGLLASLVDSTMDGAASLINLFAIRYAMKPADAEHRFGHGKAEFLAGLAQSMFICGSSLFLLLHGVDRILNPRPIEASSLAIGVMVFSIGLTGALILLQRHAVRQTESAAIKADSLHYVSDLLVNVGVIIAIVLSSVGWQGFDALTGILIAVFIFYGAVQVARESIQQLLDHVLPPEEVQDIAQIACSHPQVYAIHDLRTRRSGSVRFIQFHLELDGSMSLDSAHAIADAVERLLLVRFPQAEILIHQDPHGLTEHEDTLAHKDVYLLSD